MLSSKKYIILTFCLFFIGITIKAAENEKPTLKVGDLAPDFKLKNPEGKDISLSQLRGKVVLLDFWASWCMPCRMANPEVVRIYNNYKSLGFDIFSVSLDAKKEAWVKAIKNDELIWPNHGSELNGWKSTICELYDVDQIPNMFLIDEDGYIIGKNLDDRQVEKQLNYIFNKQVNVYPLTAASKLYFTDKAKYKITDSQGNTILKGKSEEIDIAELPTGDYNISFDRKREETFTKRTLKQPFVTFFPTNVTDNIVMSRDAEYEIYNLRGKLVRKGSKATISCNDLPSGVYYLNIEGEINKIFKK